MSRLTVKCPPRSQRVSQEIASNPDASLVKYVYLGVGMLDKYHHTLITLLFVTAEGQVTTTVGRCAWNCPKTPREALSVYVSLDVRMLEKKKILTHSYSRLRAKLPQGSERASLEMPRNSYKSLVKYGRLGVDMLRKND